MLTHKELLFKCPNCGKENYVPFIEKGTCYFCGYQTGEPTQLWLNFEEVTHGKTKENRQP